MTSLQHMLVFANSRRGALSTCRLAALAAATATARATPRLLLRGMVQRRCCSATGSLSGSVCALPPLLWQRRRGAKRGHRHGRLCSCLCHRHGLCQPRQTQRVTRRLLRRTTSLAMTSESPNPGCAAPHLQWCSGPNPYVAVTTSVLLPQHIYVAGLLWARQLLSQASDMYQRHY
jgi:hypothetical protein